MSTGTFSEYIYSSLSNGRIPILHAVTNYLSYYNNHQYWHYIAVQAYDGPNLQFVLYDSINNPSYYGIHVVSFMDAYNAMHSVQGRRLISYH